MSRDSDVRYGRLVLGAAAVGAIVFGLGSRLAMRFIGILASPEHVGQPTAFGVVGKVTLNGVTELVVFGAIAGLFVGLGYLILRPWLPGGWALRGLTFGLVMLPPFGIIIVTSSRPDFDLVSPIVILAVFAAMILLEGLATAWVIERWGRQSLPSPHPRALGYMVLGSLASLGFVALTVSVSGVV